MFCFQNLGFNGAKNPEFSWVFTNGASRTVASPRPQDSGGPRASSPARGTRERSCPSSPVSKDGSTSGIGSLKFTEHRATSRRPTPRGPSAPASRRPPGGSTRTARGARPGGSPALREPGEPPRTSAPPPSRARGPAHRPRPFSNPASRPTCPAPQPASPAPGLPAPPPGLPPAEACPSPPAVRAAGQSPFPRWRRRERPPRRAERRRSRPSRTPGLRPPPACRSLPATAMRGSAHG